MYYLYILRCADDTLYTGITTDLSRRLAEHNSGILGAKYTKARRPVVLIHSEEHPSRSESLKKEAWLKKMPRLSKLHYIEDKKVFNNFEY